MSHDGTPTWHWQSAVSGISNFFNDDKYKNFRNLLGTAGSIAATEKGISDLKKLPGVARKELFGGDTGYEGGLYGACLLYTSPSPRDATLSRMPSSA